MKTTIPLFFAFLCLSAAEPRAQAVNPPPDGGYTGSNTTEGTNALFSLTTGVWNTANGFEALKNDTTGSINTATGFSALLRNLSGAANTAIGSRALINNVTGSNNIAVGANTGSNITTGSSNIDIGNPGSAADTGIIRIGIQNTQMSTFIAGISGTALEGPEVRVSPGGKLGVIGSSARFKDEIKPMADASKAILALNPVTFRYKEGIDAARTPQFGLVAEDVEKVNPDLVIRDRDGKPFTVRYEAVNAMLLNEFLKEHRKVQELELNAARQQKQIEALTAGLQTVNAKLEQNSLTSQMVLNTSRDRAQ
jgi:hypothetical protein